MTSSKLSGLGVLVFHIFLGMAVFVSGWTVGREVFTASDNIETGVIIGNAVTEAATIVDGFDVDVAVVVVSEYSDSCMY